MQLMVRAAELIPEGSPVRIVATSITGHLVEVADTTTDSVDGVAPREIQANSRGWMFTGGAVPINVGATSVALDDVITDGGDGYFGKTGEIIFGRALGPKNADNIAPAWFDDLDSIGQAASAGSGLPDDVYADEWGNWIFGAVNIAAFTAIDNSDGHILNCWVDSTATVIWPTDPTAPINALKAYVGADVDLTDLSATSAIGGLTVRDFAAVEIGGANNIVINSVTIEGDADVAVDSVNGTISLSNVHLFSGDYSFRPAIGGSIIVNHLTCITPDGLYIRPAGSLSFDHVLCGSYAYLFFHGAGAADLQDSTIDSATSFDHGGAGDLVAYNLRLSSGADVQITGAGNVTLSNLTMDTDGQLDLDADGVVTIDASTIRRQAYVHAYNVAQCDIDTCLVEGANAYIEFDDGAAQVQNCQVRGVLTVEPDSVTAGPCSVTDCIVEASGQLDVEPTGAGTCSVGGAIVHRNANVDIFPTSSSSFALYNCFFAADTGANIHPSAADSGCADINLQSGNLDQTGAYISGFKANLGVLGSVDTNGFDVTDVSIDSMGYVGTFSGANNGTHKGFGADTLVD